MMYQQQQQPSYSSGAEGYPTRGNPQPQQQQYGYTHPSAANAYYQQPPPQFSAAPPTQQHQQADYSKYQFLPYGQPNQQQMISQAYATSFNPYQQFHPLSAATDSINTANNSFNQSNMQGYAAYAQLQQQQHSQAMGGVGYYHQIPHPTAFVAPVPVPAPPLPVPVPPPSTSTTALSSPTRGTTERDQHSKSSSQPKPQHKEQPEFKTKGKLDKPEEEEERHSAGQPAENQPKDPVPPRKSVPIMVGKRKGGRALPTGVVKKQRPESPTEGKGTTAWQSYMNEVKKYKDRSCEDDRKNRPLVK
ncbi:ataxin-2 homolog isoform X2 [Folsomia candida]|nr:ataxin-2 homolog isoform X2 [Folsomia candida]